MDGRWMKEERQLPKQDQAQAIVDTTKVLKNSTIFQRKLDRILEEMYAETLRSDEDFSKQGWQREAIANASRRKTLREIRKLIELK
jgi:hypothetical protein